MRKYAFKTDIFRRGEDEWAGAGSQREIKTDDVKLVRQSATPRKTSIFLKGRVEIFTGRWVNWC